MKILKWVLIAAGAVILLFAGTLAFVLATFDPNQYKGEVAALVKDKTQRTLTIEGDIRLMLFPKIGVHLGKTRLSEYRSDKDFAGLDDMRVSLELFPLLSRQVVVDQIQLDGLRATLVKHNDGSTNFDDLLGKGRTPAPSKPEEPAAAPGSIKLAVDGVRIRKAALTWIDEAAGAQYAVSDFNLKTGRVAPGVPTKFEMSASILANQPKTDARLQVGGTLSADPEKQVFSVAGLLVKLAGEAAGVTGLDTELRADIEARIAERRVRVSGLKLAAGGNLGKDSFKVKAGAPAIEMAGGALSVRDFTAGLGGVIAGVTLSEGSLRVPQLNVDLDRQNVLVDGVALAVKGRRDADSFDMKLDAPKISITPRKAEGGDVVLALKAQGPKLDADIGLRLSGIQGSGKVVRVGRLALNVDARQGDDAVKGALATPVAANLETRVFQVPKLAGEFEVVSPSLPMKKLKVPLTLSATADLKKNTAAAELGMKLDESNVKAKLAAAGFTPLHSTFDVAIDKLNVDRYLPPKKNEPAAKPAPGPEQPIDFSPIKGLDVAGSVRIGDLVASNVKAQNVRVNLKVRDGKLDVNPLSAHLYQGAVKGTASVNANTSQVAVKQDLSGVQIGPLLKDAAGVDVIEGRGNVSLDVTATGNLVSAMKKTLNGTAKLELRDGAIKGINLAQSLRNAKAMLTGGKTSSEQGAAAGEKTDFSELGASFVIRNGVAHNGDLLAKSPFLRLTGEGDINLPEGSLNYLAKAAIVATSTGQEGRDLADLKGLTIPVRVSGPFTALKYKLEFGSVLSDAARQKLKEKQGELTDKLKSKLLGAPESGAPAAGTPPAGQAPSSTEDKLKQKLRKLF
ncbi:MAG TPA: AsmA family protein [Burkholderiales bacterium]|nr:AsmA family protein [Burkholderiales bacterium]